MRARGSAEQGVGVWASWPWPLLLGALLASGCGACQAPSRTCASTGDCVDGELCVQALCRAVCNSQRDCTGHEACVDGVCLPAADAGAVDAARGDRALTDGLCLDGCGQDRALADSAPSVEAGADAAVSDGAAIADALPADLASGDQSVADSALPDASIPDLAPADQGGLDQFAPDQVVLDQGVVDGGAGDASGLEQPLVDQLSPDLVAADQGGSDGEPADQGLSDTDPPEVEVLDAGTFDSGPTDTSSPDSGGNCWFHPSLNTRWPLQISNPTGVELEDFPVLLRLDCSRVSCAVFGLGGSVLRLADRSCGQLAHEIERWDSAGVSLIWFKLPRLPSGQTQPLAYLYGDAQAAVPPAPLPSEQVWSNGYQGVYHLGATVADSSPLHNDGTDSGTAQVSAAIGLGRALDSSQAIRLEDNQPLLQAVDGATVEAWVLLDSAAQPDSVNLISISVGSVAPTLNSRVQLVVNPATALGATVRRLDNEPDTPQTLRPSLSRGVLHHVVLRVRYSTATLDCTVDGAAGDELAMTWTGQGLTSDTPSRNAALGAQDDGSGRFLRGVLDEVRVSSTARSDAWIALDHLSQQAPGIVVVGEPEVQ